MAFFRAERCPGGAVSWQEAGRGHCVNAPSAAYGVGCPLGGAAPRILVQEELHTVVGAQQSLDPHPQEAKATGRGGQG